MAVDSGHGRFKTWLEGNHEASRAGRPSLGTRRLDKVQQVAGAELHGGWFQKIDRTAADVRRKGCRGRLRHAGQLIFVPVVFAAVLDEIGSLRSSLIRHRAVREDIVRPRHGLVGVRRRHFFIQRAA